MLIKFSEARQSDAEEVQYAPTFSMQNYVVSDDPNKQVFLGDMYYFGDGISTGQDYDKAFELYHKAAQQGSAEAKYKLGLMYHRGKSVEQDYNQARKLFERAANQNYAKAQHNLGVMYYSGESVNRDYVQAREWFEKAAYQNHAGSQFNLGVIYEDGEGVPRNIETAKQWFSKSCNNGNQRGCNSYQLLNGQ